jgi:hypothetical protein
MQPLTQTLFSDSDSDTENNEAGPSTVASSPVVLCQRTPRGFRLQGKAFFFTWPRCSMDPDVALRKLRKWRPLVKAVVVQERHKDGGLHLHAAFWLVRRMDLSSYTTLDAILGVHGNYQRLKKPVDSVRYLLKDPVKLAEYGMDAKEYVANARAHHSNSKDSRTSGKWAGAVAHIAKDASLLDFEDQGFIARNLRSLLAYKSYVRTHRPRHRVGDWDIKCAVIVGPTGVGKSHWARYGHGLDGGTWVLPVQRGGGVWWDTYDGENVLVLDDFDPKTMSILQLLRVLDKYTFVGMVKGSTVTADWTRVIITNNLPVSQWYPDADLRRVAALKRRLVEINVTRRGYFEANFDEMISVYGAEQVNATSNLLCEYYEQLSCQ